MSGSPADGANPKIEVTADRRAALDGADYAISMFQVGGYKPGTVVDFEVPKKYGLRQTIADTLGISVKTVENQMGKAIKVLKAFARENKIYPLLYLFFIW